MLVMPYLGPQLDEPAVPIFILAVSLYTLARWITDLRGLAGIVAISLMLLGDYLFQDSRSHNFSDVVFVASILLPPYVLGRLVRRLALQKELLEEREELVKREAVRDERDRIARELHDVIAHSISAMVVQTAAAEDLLRTDPERATVLLRSVAAAGRRALAETGRLLYLVRDDSDELGLHPPPGLADLPALVQSFRETGLEVDAELAAPESLPGGFDVSVYRIVQEALTNAARHGRGVVRLAVGVEGARLRIRCANAVAPDDAPGSGLGLRGMQERVEVLGGTLSSGASADGFVLEVDLPLVAEPVS